MSKKDEQEQRTRTKGRLLVEVTPSPEDLRRADTIPATACPRRYCWWWRSLAFDWELTPRAGCTFFASPKPPGLPQQEVPCRRCDATARVDHYEPREPHLLKDGFAVSRWLSEEHHRPTGEISYDLVMDNDMAFAEGTYRVGDCAWCVFSFSKRHAFHRCLGSPAPGKAV
jgi:hypothetical protein